MKIDQFDNNQLMRRMIVCPVEASDEDLMAFIAPYIPTEIRRGDRSTILFWYSGEFSLKTVRERIDAWEIEHDRLGHERWEREHDAKWKRLDDLTEPELW